MHALCAWLMVMGLLNSVSTRALAGEVSRVVEAFQIPVRTKAVAPVYPNTLVESGQDGWIELQFMVGTDGKPYEIAVTDSMGAAGLEQAAVKAAEQWEYQPAQLNGSPLDAALRHRVTFALTGDKGGVRRRFAREFRLIRQHVDKGEREAALGLLEQIDVRSLYEGVFAEIAWYLYFARWGTPEQQRIVLTRASESDPDLTRVPIRFTQMIILARFSVELQTSHFGAALKTLALMDRLQEQRTMRFDSAQTKSIRDARQAIDDLKDNDKAFSVNGKVGDHANWVYTLLKDEMSFDVHQGEIAELKLRCEKRFVGFRFAEHSTFRIPSSFGACELEVIGNPGTTFTLTQS